MRFPDSSSTLTGREIEEKLLLLKGQAREDYFLELVTNGNIPDFLRSTSVIALKHWESLGELEVLCDHLCVGTDDDFLYAQVNIVTAQKIADLFDAMLPTPHLVDRVWEQAEVRLLPMPWGPPYDSTMFSSLRLVAQSRRVSKQRREAKAPLGQLTAGNFKDYVLIPEMEQRKDRTCIYGWHLLNGKPIQGVQLNAHERTYVDYSQAPRFVAKTVNVNGLSVPIEDLLSDPKKYQMVSRDLLPFTRVPGE